MNGLMFPVLLVLTSFMTALVALYLLPYLPRTRGERRDDPGMIGEDTVFLFDDELLVDATPQARNLLSFAAPGDSSDWQRFLSLMLPRFPGLQSALSDLASREMVMVEDAAGTSQIRAHWLNGVARISVLGDHSEETQGIDTQSLGALRDELSLLRELVSNAPSMAWVTDSSGQIAWANKPYLDAVRDLKGAEATLVWPLPHLFKPEDLDSIGDGMAPRRLPLKQTDGDQGWFDCQMTAVETGRAFYATPADATMRAESALGNFRQVLTQTFAQLPSGIAIFNRARQLVMFNPALTDLLMLEPQFLTSRPSLDGFLDRLRDRQMVPEPKNFKEWRAKMAKLEQEAASGVYQETWALPTGQTLRLTGRPHPDGAVAFIFDDISSEVSLTRRFRTELEVSQSVFDSLNTGIAVVSSSGILVNTNQSYIDIWGHDPASGLGEFALSEIGAFWSGQTAQTEAVKTLISNLEQRLAWTGTLSLTDGRVLGVEVKPVSAGATAVLFRPRVDGAISAEPARIVSQAV